MLDAHLNAQRGVDTSLVSMRSGDAEGEGHRAQCHGELATSAMDTARDFESIRGSTYSFQMYRSGASPASAHRQNPTPPGSGRSSLRSPGQVPEASPAPRICASSMAGPSMGHAYSAYQYRMHDFRHHHVRPLRRCCWRRYAHAAATSATNRYRMCCRQTLWSASAKLAVSHEPSLRIRRFSRCRSCFGPAPGQEHIKCWTRHVHFQPEQVNRAIWAFVITVLVRMLVLAVYSRTARP